MRRHRPRPRRHWRSPARARGSSAMRASRPRAGRPAPRPSIPRRRKRARHRSGKHRARRSSRARARRPGTATAARPSSVPDLTARVVTPARDRAVRETGARMRVPGRDGHRGAARRDRGKPRKPPKTPPPSTATIATIRSPRRVRAASPETRRPSLARVPLSAMRSGLRSRTESSRDPLASTWAAAGARSCWPYDAAGRAFRREPDSSTVLLRNVPVFRRIRVLRFASNYMPPRRRASRKSVCVPVKSA